MCTEHHAGYTPYSHSPRDVTQEEQASHGSNQPFPWQPFTWEQKLGNMFDQIAQCRLTWRALWIRNSWMKQLLKKFLTRVYTCCVPDELPHLKTVFGIVWYSFTVNHMFWVSFWEVDMVKLHEGIDCNVYGGRLLTVAHGQYWQFHSLWWVSQLRLCVGGMHYWWNVCCAHTVHAQAWPRMSPLPKRLPPPGGWGGEIVVILFS